MEGSTNRVTVLDKDGNFESRVVGKYDLQLKRQRYINQVMLEFFAVNNVPFSLFDSAFWYRLVTTLDPHCNVLSRKTMHNYLVDYTNNEVRKYNFGTFFFMIVLINASIVLGSSK